MLDLIKITVLLIASAQAKRLDKQKIIWAVNCGSSKSIESSDGYVYMAVILRGLNSFSL